MEVKRTAGPLWFVFNELSARVGADTPHEGRRRLDDLVDSIRKVMNGNAAHLVSLGEPQIWEAELAAEYTISDWVVSTERDRRALLLKIATKTEFPAEAGAALKGRFHLSEFFVPAPPGSSTRTEARGLGAAFILDGIGVSIPSESRWRQLWIPLQHVWLDDDADERETAVKALNLCGSDQVRQLSGELLRRRRLGMKDDLSALAERKRECFPHLAFGRDVDGQLAKLPFAILGGLWSKLLALDEACKNWRRDPAMSFPRMSGCSPESEPTMQKYGEARVFRDAEGQRRTYERHVAVGPYRVHLRVIDEPRGIEIGYVGKHLPTVKHH